MHPSAMEFLNYAILAKDVAGKRILEVGSFNVNGTARDVVALHSPPAEYIGVDMRMGPGVDIQLNASELLSHFGKDRFDTVISTEMLEHAEDWRSAIQGMKDVLVPGGTIIITARGPGMNYHPEETAEGIYGDYWRYTLLSTQLIFADFETKYLGKDPGLPGVFYKGCKPETNWEPVDLYQVEVLPV